MEKTMFADIPPEDRLRLLIDNCDDRREETYMKDLSREDLDIRMEKLTGNFIKIHDLDKELKEIKSQYKSQTDPLKLDNETLLAELKTGKAQTKGHLFEFFEDGMVNTYDAIGELVGSRRQTPVEKMKQGKLFIAHGKTGSGE